MLRYVCFLILIANIFARSVAYYDRDTRPRVVNGTDAPPGKYPFMVSYQYKHRHSCGGTILNENWILTASHCVDGDDASSITILSGTVDRNNGGNRHQVTDLILHEDYNRLLLFNDIALVRVAEPFTFDQMTQPIPLPVQDQMTPGGSNTTLIGWGLPYTGGSAMQFLQEVDYWVVTDDECRAAHSNIIFDSNICAYYPGGGKGQCSGDSGGPLLADGVQIGIVSWSEKPCTVAPYPGVLTEVSYFIDWIFATIY